MSLDVARWRPAPLARAPGFPKRAWLSVTVAVLTTLAALASVLTIAAARGAPEWTSRLSGSATVVPRSAGLESPEAAAARAAEILSRLPGVADARVLDPAPTDGLLSAVIDGAPLEPINPPPLLVAVTSTRPAAADLARALSADGVEAAIDDHGLWTGPVERAVLLALLGVAALFTLVLLIIATAAAAAIRQSLAGEQARVTLLHRLGARDGFVMGPWRAAVVSTIGWSSAAGAALAAVAGVMTPAWAGRFEAARPLMSLLQIDPLDLLAAAVWPAAAVVVGLVATTAGATAVLRRWP